MTDAEQAAAPGTIDAVGTTSPGEEAVRHALERLEAALRARTAGGFTRG
jgi:hypothetical protein